MSRVCAHTHAGACVASPQGSRLLKEHKTMRSSDPYPLHTSPRTTPKRWLNRWKSMHLTVQLDLPFVPSVFSDIHPSPTSTHIRPPPTCSRRAPVAFLAACWYLSSSTVGLLAYVRSWLPSRGSLSGSPPSPPNDDLSPFPRLKGASSAPASPLPRPPPNAGRSSESFRLNMVPMTG